MTLHSTHTGSYYAATVNYATDYPPLKGAHNTDVCVIGAGFTGISTALCLAERGYQVRVLEANKVGWGASGRNGGQLIGGIAGEMRIAKHWRKEPDDLFGELRWEGHRIIRDRVRQYNIECDLKFGYLDVAIRKRHLAAFQEDQQRSPTRCVSCRVTRPAKHSAPPPISVHCLIWATAIFTL